MSFNHASWINAISIQRIKQIRRSRSCTLTRFQYWNWISAPPREVHFSISAILNIPEPFYNLLSSQTRSNQITFSSLSQLHQCISGGSTSFRVSLFAMICLSQDYLFFDYTCDRSPAKYDKTKIFIIKPKLYQNCFGTGNFAGKKYAQRLIKKSQSRKF